jgi:hypothetical protein
MSTTIIVILAITMIGLVTTQYWLDWHRNNMIKRHEGYIRVEIPVMSRLIDIHREQLYETDEQDRIYFKQNSEE